MRGEKKSIERIEREKEREEESRVKASGRRWKEGIGD